MNKIEYKNLSGDIDEATLKMYHRIIQPFSIDEDSGNVHFKKKGKCTRSEAYLRGEDKIKLSKSDEAFKKKRDRLTPLVGYGLHSCAYYGFFKPDIVEVITLLSTLVTPDMIDKRKPIYVSTELHPYADLSACYDQEKDKHRGKTYFYFSRSAPQPKL